MAELTTVTVTYVGGDAEGVYIAEHDHEEPILPGGSIDVPKDLADRLLLSSIWSVKAASRPKPADIKE